MGYSSSFEDRTIRHPPLRPGAALLALLACTSGCAFVPVHVELDTSAPRLSWEGGGQREVIVFPALDRRPDTERCGAVRNGFGAETANVYCNVPPAAWLSELLVRSLDRAHFKTVTVPTAKSPAPLRIHLALMQLFVESANVKRVTEGEAQGGEALTGVVADLHVRVVAETTSGLLATRSFFVHGIDSSGLPSSYEHSIARAGRHMADALVVAILALTERYPEIGTIPEEAGAAVGADTTQ